MITLYTGGVTMYYEKDLLETFAEECIEKIDASTIEYFKMHIDYTHHHFGYGLYLRNKYVDRVDCESDYARDNLGHEIYIHILSKIFPEFGNDFEKIKVLTDSSIFKELFACYYIKTDRIIPKDFPISKFNYVDFNRYDEDDFDVAYDKWHMEYEKNFNAYITPIAEYLWNYNELKKQAVHDGISEENIDSIYALAKECLKEKAIFIPLEIVYYSRTKKLDRVTLDVINKYMAYFFQNHSRDIDILPKYIFDDREFVKNAVRSNGYTLEYAKKFRNDYEIVKLAVENSPRAIQFASNKLKNDIDIVKTALTNSKNTLIFELACMKKYKDDEQLVKLALKANGANICYTSRRIRDNYEMAKYALKHQRNIYPCSAYGAMSARLRDDKSLAMIELQSEHPCISEFSNRLKNDDEIAEYIYKRKRIRWMMYQMRPRIRKKYNAD